MFSSDRRPDADQYAIYRSRAAEVTDETSWETANWQAFIVAWPWTLLLMAIMLAFFLLFHYTRGWLFEKASVARFFLASLLLHLLLVILAGFVTVGKAILEKRDEIIVAVQGVEILDNNLHQSHQPGEEAYEKTADLQSVEQVVTQDVNRQVVTAPNIPQQPETLAPTISAATARRLPARLVQTIPPPPAAAQPISPAPPSPDLQRRAPRLPASQAVAEMAAELPHAEAMPSERSLERSIDLAKQAAFDPAPTAPPALADNAPAPRVSPAENMSPSPNTPAPPDSRTAPDTLSQRGPRFPRPPGP